MAEPALDLSEIIDLYKDDAKRMIAEMQTAVNRWSEVAQGGPARQELRRLSHQLRGSGRTYGFRDVSRLSKAIEQIVLKMEKHTVESDERSQRSIMKKVSRLAGVFSS